MCDWEENSNDDIETLSSNSGNEDDSEESVNIIESPKNNLNKIETSSSNSDNEDDSEESVSIIESPKKNLKKRKLACSDSETLENSETYTENKPKKKKTSESIDLNKSVKDSVSDSSLLIQDNDETKKKPKLFELWPSESNKYFQAPKSNTDVESFSVVAKDLPAGVLKHKKLNDANAEEVCRMNVAFVLFHTTKKLIVVGGAEGVVNLFRMDGDKINRRVCAPYVFERFPLKQARFWNENLLVLTSKFNSFKTICLKTGAVGHRIISMRRGTQINFKCIDVSPCPTSRWLVIGSKQNHLYVVSPVSMEMSYDLQVSSKPMAVTFSHNGRYLYVATNEGRVSIYEFPDSANMRPIFRRQWNDMGSGLGINSIAVSPDNNYIVCGSKTGHANIYTVTSVWENEYPEPKKSHGPLAGRVNLLKFSHDSKLLLMGTVVKSISELEAGKGGQTNYKLVHMDSLTLFSNFPDRIATQYRPTSASFSPNGKFLAVGMGSGRVVTYWLHHYTEY